MLLPQLPLTSRQIKARGGSWVALATLVVSHTFAHCALAIHLLALCILHIVMLVVYGWFMGDVGLRSG